MNTSNDSNVYLCPVHKILQYGIKRITFELDLHNAIVNSSMKISQSLYKNVQHGCHCQTNYNKFDKLTNTTSTPIS